MQNTRISLKLDWRKKMLNEFVLVTEKKSSERFFINLSDISFIRENKEDEDTVISFKSKEKLFIHVHEGFESFVEFFEEQNSDGDTGGR